MTTAEFVSDLRAAADFFEQHPEITEFPHPFLVKTLWGDDATDVLRTFAKAAGKVTKHFSSDEIQVAMNFPGGMMIRYDAPRDKVCERVVVGTKVIPARVIPPQPEEVVIPEKIEEIVEWRCHPLMEVEHA